MKYQEVTAHVAESENIVLIHFDHYIRFKFTDFIEQNPMLTTKKVVFVPQKPKKSKQITIKIPVYSRFELMKKTLSEKGLL